MPVPATINDLSTTAGNNSPAGSESPTLTDDYLRRHASFIATLRDADTTINTTIATINTTLANTVVRSGGTTGAAILPPGTTAQRPGTPANGMFRYNTDAVDFEGYIGGAWVPRSTFTKAVNEAPVATLASAATVDIGAANANTINVTGSTNITSLGTAASGVTRRLIFQGAITIVHNFPTVILPGTASILAIPGDVAEFLSLGGGNWQCISYQRITGYPVVNDIYKQLCTAWVNFNGTGVTIAMRDSYNVSSLVDNGTGLYGLNFTTAMTNANYCAVGNAVSTLGTQQNTVAWISPYNPSTTSLQLSASASTSGLNDMAVVNVAIFGGR